MFNGDYKGDYLLNKDEELNKGLVNKPFSERCLIFFTQGINACSPSSRIATRARNAFIKYWIPKAQKLMEGKKIKVYRGIGLYPSDLEKNPELWKTAIKRNLLDRNSWTINPAVALNYSKTIGVVRLIAEMECTLADCNLYYSAWLEGYWCDCGSSKSYSGANDEFNLKQMLNVQNIKLHYADPKDKYGNRYAQKYLGINK